jgi:hypothetical protein
MTQDAETALARLRDFCLAMPGAEERVSHRAPVFVVGEDKVFAYFWHDHHGDGETVAVVRTTGAEEQRMLIEGEPDLYHLPAELAAFGWVAMRLTGADTDWDRVGDRIAVSWELAAPRDLLEVGGR